MTPQEIDKVETSFAALGPVTRSLGLAFYDRLFELDPTTRPLFRSDMDEQALRLMQVLAYAVANLRAPEALLPTIRDLGRRHVGYGVTSGQYDSMRDALLKTLAAALGSAWSEEAAHAWGAAMDTISGEMLAGAAEG
ncbi:MAG: globin domain-containing protein [Beijerinckiaceae bacterium]